MPPGSALASAARLAAAQFVLYAVIGVYIPYFPVWLESRGFDESDIARLIAIPSFARVFLSPPIAHLVDKTPRKRLLVTLVTTFCLLAFLTIPYAPNFAWMLVANIAFYSTFCALTPLIEYFAIAVAREVNLPYGRIRVFGSSGFLIATVLVGKMLDHLPPQSVYYAIGAVLGLGVLVTLGLPAPPHRPPTTAATEGTYTAKVSWAPLLWVAFVCGLIQASHGTYYMFSTLHWKSLGIAEGTIGKLWAIGVLSEIVLFTFGSQVVARVGAVRMCVLGAGIAVFRWAALPFVHDPLALGFLQTTHAASFGATYLATLALLQKVAPPGREATAQSILYSVSGVLSATSMYASGFLFELFNDRAYFVMCAAAGIGLAMIPILRFRDSVPLDRAASGVVD